MRKLKVGLFGSNGHQVERQFPDIQDAELAAACGIDRDRLSHLPVPPAMYESFGDFLNHPGLDLVSICSNERSQQYEHIKAALDKGKHVYAEKPLVMHPHQLTELTALAGAKGLTLRDMSTTIYESPYAEIREVVAAGTIGEVVQVYIQKSYPYADWRPQDENTDGGLILQVGIHAMRIVEHVAMLRAESMSALHTSFGNPRDGGELKMAAGINMRMKNGALGLVVLNYLNRLSPAWCNDQLRMFGTRGYIESTEGGRRVEVIAESGKRKVPLKQPESTHFQWVVKDILGIPTPLLPAERELQSLRLAFGARESAFRQGAVYHIS